MSRVKSSKKNLKDFLWAPNVENSQSLEDMEGDSASGGEASSNTINNNNNNASNKGAHDKCNEFAESIMGDHGEAYTSAAAAAPNSSPSPAARMSRELNKSESGRLMIKDLLDPWVEPEVKGEKVRDR